MINLIYDPEEERYNEITIRAEIILTPLIDSDSKILLCYLIYHSKFPDFRFSWSSFQSATGIKRKRYERIKELLVDKLGIVCLTEHPEGARIIYDSVTVDMNRLLNHLHKPLTTRTALQNKKYRLYNKRIVKSELDEVADEIEVQADWEN